MPSELKQMPPMKTIDYEIRYTGFGGTRTMNVGTDERLARTAFKKYRSTLGKPRTRVFLKRVVKETIEVVESPLVQPLAP